MSSPAPAVSPPSPPTNASSPPPSSTVSPPPPEPVTSPPPSTSLPPLSSDTPPRLQHTNSQVHEEDLCINDILNYISYGTLLAVAHARSLPGAKSNVELNGLPQTLTVNQGAKRKLDLLDTRNNKKAKGSLQPPVRPVEASQQKAITTPVLPRRRTRSSTKSLGMASKSTPSHAAEHVTLEYDTESSSASEGISKDESETESDGREDLVPQTPQVSSTNSLETCLIISSPQDLTARRAMVSTVEEDMDFDFSFLGPEQSQPVSSSSMPSGLKLATAKASLRHFLNMNLSTLGTMERATILSAASILKTSSGFSQPSAFSTLDNLSSMFSAFQDSSSTCSETLIQVGNFKARKEKLDVMISGRRTILSTLQQNNKAFDIKAELAKKLEAELKQQKADMMTILHDSEVLKISSDELKVDIQSLGDELVSQKEAYQHWEDTLKKAESVRADCQSKWEALRSLGLS